MNIQIRPRQGNQNIKTRHHPQVMSQQFMDVYLKALKYSNLCTENQLLHRNVVIFENEHIHEVYTQSSPKLPHLLLLHGYGGTSLTFIRTFEHLINHFQIHALDTFGVGLSSRGAWSDKMSAEQTARYYVESIEAWRKQVGIDSFILAGHSFGGYISSLYLQKYPQRVKQLILLSPAGIGKISEETIRQRQQNSKFWFCFAEKVYNMNFRPSRIMNAFWIGNKFIDKILKNRLKLPEQEQQVWKKYLKLVSQQKQSSQTGFYTFFNWPLQPIESIQQKIKRINTKHRIDILFGDNDWMNKEGAHRLITQFNNIKLHQVSEAGHQLIFDNPTEIARMIKELCE